MNLYSKQQLSIDLGQRSKDDRVIIFLHIPKSGGTTIHGIINQNYSKYHTFRFDGINSSDKINKIPTHRRAKLKLIRGHFAFGLHQFLSCDSTYFTILRDPIDRFISHYNYVRRSPGLAGHDRLQTMSLEDYVLYEGQMNGNIQTKMLFGLSNNTSAMNEVDILNVVKHNLETHFAIVGLVEKFDETLLLLRYAFGWRMPVYIKQNVTSPQQLKASDINHKTIEVVKEFNSLDLQLYEWAEKRFKENLITLGSRFEQDLRKQKLVNILYQPIGRTYGLTRSFIFNNYRKIN